MKNKKMIRGIIIGTLAPLIFGLLVKIIFYNYIPFSNLMQYPKLIAPFLQWGIIANLLLFYYFMVKNKQEEQKGIVLPSLIFTFIVLLLKFYI